MKKAPDTEACNLVLLKLAYRLRLNYCITQIVHITIFGYN